MPSNDQIDTGRHGLGQPDIVFKTKVSQENENITLILQIEIFRSRLKRGVEGKSFCIVGMRIGYAVLIDLKKSEKRQFQSVAQCDYFIRVESDIERIISRYIGAYKTEVCFLSQLAES